MGLRWWCPRITQDGKKSLDLPSPLPPPGESRVGLIKVYRGPAGQMASSPLPSPMVRVRELSSVYPRQQWGDGVGKTQQSLLPHAISLCRLFTTQRSQGTGGESICKDPLPEGGPRMYCPLMLTVNTLSAQRTQQWWAQ